MRGQTLREAADLSQNGQVFYRVEEHLQPVGLVQKAARTERNGYVEPRRFRLTEVGKEWMGKNASALTIPTTREEAVLKAGEAHEASQAATATQRDSCPRNNDKGRERRALGRNRPQPTGQIGDIPTRPIT